MSNTFPAPGATLENQMANENNMNHLIALYLKNRKKEVIKLLSVNGISLPPLASDKAVAIAFLKANKDNETFRNQASQLLSMYVQSMPDNTIKTYVTGKKYHNTIGVDEEYIDPTQPWLGTIPINTGSSGATTNTASSNSGSSSSGGGFWSSLKNVFTPDVLATGIKTGLNALNTSITSKANQTSEQNALEAQQKQLELLQAQIQLKQTPSASSPFPTWLKVTLGIAGAGVMVTVIVVLIRKKGKAKAA